MQPQKTQRQTHPGSLRPKFLQTFIFSNGSEWITFWKLGIKLITVRSIWTHFDGLMTRLLLKTVTNSCRHYRHQHYTRGLQTFCAVLRAPRDSGLWRTFWTQLAALAALQPATSLCWRTAACKIYRLSSDTLSHFDSLVRSRKVRSFGFL